MQRIWLRFQIGSGGCVPRRRRLAALVSALPCPKNPDFIYLGWETSPRFFQEMPTFEAY